MRFFILEINEYFTKKVAEESPPFLEAFELKGIMAGLFVYN